MAPSEHFAGGVVQRSSAVVVPRVRANAIRERGLDVINIVFHGSVEQTVEQPFTVLEFTKHFIKFIR